MIATLSGSFAITSTAIKVINHS
ncbi:hypothetical protein VCHENC02_1575A, partial [Vibrio harveyi]